jgi:hypothetical protein
MKNKIEFNQESIKQFFTHHWEKVAFGVGVVSIALFAYFGMNAESYDKTNPAKLNTKVIDAENYMDRSTWDAVKPFRKVDTEAPIRIAQSLENPVDNADYTYNYILGTPLKSQTLRIDPSLLGPTNLYVDVRRAAAPWDEVATELNALPLRTPEAAAKPSEGGGGNNREGGEQGILGGPEGGIGGPATGSAIGKGGGLAGGGTEGATLPNNLQGELQKEYPGVRPNSLRLTITSAGPLPMNIICVTGLVPVKQQKELFQDVFENSVGYNQLRDIPRYTHIEVMMKEDEKEWEDISKIVNVTITRQLIGRGPEPVKKEYLDPALTKPIPAFLGFDYRRFVNHPMLENHHWYKPSDPVEKKEEKKPGNVIDIFTGGNKKEDKSTDEKKETKDTNYLLLRFFYPAAKEGSTYQFKVRLWLADPNNPELAKFKDLISEEGRSTGAGQLTGDGQAMAAGQSGIESGNKAGDRGGAAGAANAGPVSLFMLDPKVRNRLSEEKEKRKADKKPAADAKSEEEILKQRLSVSRPTEWSEPTEPVTVGTPNSSFYAGDVTADTSRVEDFEYPDGETTGSLVVQTRISDVKAEGAAENKTVYPGDGLNWKSVWTVLHPIDWSVRYFYNIQTDAKPTDEKEGKVVQTDAFVVDIIGGRSVRNLKTNEKDYLIPGQFLIMDADGNFVVADEVKDQGKYRVALAKTQIGEQPKPRRTEEESDDDDGRGRIGGGSIK